MVARFLDSFLLATIMLLNQQRQTGISMQPTPVPRAKSRNQAGRTPTFDSYRFYSKLYRNARGIESGELLAFAAKPKSFPSSVTCNPKPRNPEDAALLKQAAQAVADDAMWNEQFDIKQNYLLVSQEDVTQVFDCIQDQVLQQSSPACRRYKDVRSIRAISIPAFNANRTRALIAI